jgi:hypothetical protein
MMGKREVVEERRSHDVKVGSKKFRAVLWGGGGCGSSDWFDALGLAFGCCTLSTHMCRSSRFCAYCTHLHLHLPPIHTPTAPTSPETQGFSTLQPQSGTLAQVTWSVTKDNISKVRCEIYTSYISAVAYWHSAFAHIYTSHFRLTAIRLF